MPTVNSNTSFGVVSTTLNASDLEALYNTPIVLLPAPGTNLMYNVLSVDWVYNYGTTQYSSTAGNFWVATDATNNTHNTAWAVVGCGTMIGGISSLRILNSGSGSPLVPNAALSYFSNQAVQLGGNAGNGGIAGGDGTLTVTLTYVLTSVY